MYVTYKCRIFVFLSLHQRIIMTQDITYIIKNNIKIILNLYLYTFNTILNLYLLFSFLFIKKIDIQYNG